MSFMTTCLWFDNQAEEAVKFYMSAFKNSKMGITARYGKAGAEMSGQKEGSVMTVSFKIEDLDIVALNGGPMFKFSPSLSLFLHCENEKEARDMWGKLSPGGKVRMDLAKYPWSELYGWTTDKFGVDWQIIVGPMKAKISPAFLFTDKLFGKGEEAIRLYTSIFPNSKVDMMEKDPKSNTVMFASFTLNGQNMILMEGAGDHGHEFTHATSIMVNCKDQKEIDFYWDKLSAGGETEPCGWLKDKFGVSWQIVPEQIDQFMDKPEKAEKIMAAMMPMKKLDVEKLLSAAR